MKPDEIDKIISQVNFTPKHVTHEKLKELYGNYWGDGPEPDPYEGRNTDEEPWEDEEPGFVYFVQAASGPVKIGYSMFPKTRAECLQVGHWEELTLLGYVEGTKADEEMLHQRFKQQHIRGEWFRPAKRLLKFVDTAVKMGAI